MISLYAKLFSVLGASETKRFAALTIALLASGILEALGVASVMPFLAYLAAPSSLETLPFGNALSEASQSIPWIEPHVLLGGAVLIMLVVGLAARALSHFLLTRYGFRQSYLLSTRLLAAYLKQGYSWFLGQNTSALGKMALSEVDQVVNKAIIPAMKIVAHGFVVLFLTALIIAVDPVIATLAAGILGATYFAIFFALKNWLSRLGAIRLKANTERFRYAQEMLTGIKSVKVGGLEQTYVSRFSKPARAFSERETWDQVASEIPRYILEAVTFGGMLSLLILLLATSPNGVLGILPLLGLYAFAGYRLLPAMQQVFGNATRLQAAAAALEALHQHLIVLDGAPTEPETAPTPRIAPKMSIELRDITFAYPDHAPTIGRLNLKISANTTVAFVGSTGAGKTTVLDILMGLLTPQQGALVIDDMVITAANARQWRSAIGYVSQDIFLTDDTISANVAFGVAPKNVDNEAVVRATRIAGLHDFIQRLPNTYSTVVGERGVRLSGGQKQRIGIARALYHDPPVLILDEATSALDNRTEGAIMDAIDNMNHRKTIIIVAHRLTTVEKCDKIYLLEDGNVAKDGTFSELLQHSEQFRALALKQK